MEMNSLTRLAYDQRAELEAEWRSFAAEAERLTTSCAAGEMVWHRWNAGAPSTVVLFHGGSGSWAHWLKNINMLLADHEVLVPDLPGLGDSDMPPADSSAADTAAIVSSGLRELNAVSFHLIGFSWGACLASIVAAAMQENICSLLLVGVAAVGDLGHRAAMKPLLKRSRDMTEIEIWEVNRENLSRLMFCDADNIDPMSIYLQVIHTNRSRFDSPQFARSRLTLDHLAMLENIPVGVIYGDHDAPAFPNFAVRQEKLEAACPGLEFHLVAGGGHWLQYEKSEWFNTFCLKWLARSSRSSAR